MNLTTSSISRMSWYKVIFLIALSFCFTLPLSVQAQEVDLVIGDDDEDVTDPPPSFSPPDSTFFCLTIAATNSITINVDNSGAALSAGAPIVQIALFDLSANKVFDQTYNNSTVVTAGVSYQTTFNLPNVSTLPEGDYYMRIKLIDNTNFNRQAVYDDPDTPGPEKDTFFPVRCSENCTPKPQKPNTSEGSDMYTWLICIIFILLGLLLGGFLYRKLNL